MCTIRSCVGLLVAVVASACGNGGTSAGSSTGGSGGTGSLGGGGSAAVRARPASCVRPDERYVVEPRSDDRTYDAANPLAAPLVLRTGTTDGSKAYMASRKAIYVIDASDADDIGFRAFYSTGSELNLISQHVVREDDVVIVHAGRTVAAKAKEGGPLSELPAMGKSPVGLLIDGTVGFAQQVHEEDGELATLTYFSHDLLTGEETDLITPEDARSIQHIDNPLPYQTRFVLDGEALYGFIPTSNVAGDPTEVWRLPRAGGTFEILSISGAPAPSLYPFAARDGQLFLFSVQEEPEFEAAVIRVSTAGGVATVLGTSRTLRALEKVRASWTDPRVDTALFPVDGGYLIQVENEFYFLPHGLDQLYVAACVETSRSNLDVHGAAIIGDMLFINVSDSLEGGVVRIWFQ